LATSIAERSTGASRNASNPPCSAVDAQHGREQQRGGEYAGGLLAGDRVAVEAEVEDDERDEGEQHHRGHGLPRAHLHPQILAQHDERGPHA
jgi:hypothetical protein